MPETRHAQAGIFGRWDATLTPVAAKGESYDVPVELQVESTGSEIHASLVNGTDAIPFTSVTFAAGEYKLRLAQYDATLSVRCENMQCDRLIGEYTRTTRSGVGRYTFRARRHGIDLITDPFQWKAPSMDGKWNFELDYPAGNTDRVAPATFKQARAQVIPGDGAQAKVAGTIAPVSGDYGMLHGRIWLDKAASNTPKFTLSRFDGIHAMLIEGQFAADGSMRGVIHFNPVSSLSFTATRNSGSTSTAAAPPSPEAVTSVKDPAAVFQFEAIDPHSSKRLTSADFAGKPLMIDIFGTWCPNCHDEAPLLADLYNRYKEQGLQIVGLAYEYTADQQRSARLLDVFRQKYKIDYPLLLAGTTDEGQIQKTLPQLEGFGAYPTTIFIDRTGHVRAIHAGFEGPATGSNEAVKQRFEQLVKELVQ